MTGPADPQSSSCITIGITYWERGVAPSLVPTLGIFQVRTHLLPQLSWVLWAEGSPVHPPPKGPRWALCGTLKAKWICDLGLRGLRAQRADLGDGGPSCHLPLPRQPEFFTVCPTLILLELEGLRLALTAPRRTAAALGVCPQLPGASLVPERALARTLASVLSHVQ